MNRVTFLNEELAQRFEELLGIEQGRLMSITDHRDEQGRLTRLEIEIDPTTAADILRAYGLNVPPSLEAVSPDGAAERS